MKVMKIHIENSAKGILAIVMLVLTAIVAMFLWSLIPSIVVVAVLALFIMIASGLLMLIAIAALIMFGVPASIFVVELVHWAFMFTFMHDSDENIPKFPPKYDLTLFGENREVQIDNALFSAFIIVVAVGIIGALIVGFATHPIITGCILVVGLLVIAAAASEY